jgi:peptidoglycan/LPS O-acetylase OafA/YrhL
VTETVVAAEGVPQREATIDQAGERRSAQIESLRAIAALSVLVCQRLPGVLAASDAWFAGAIALWLAVVLNGYDWDFLIAPASFLVLGACVLDLRPGAIQAMLALRWLALLGIASYSLYLWHFPVLELLTNQGASPELLPLAALTLPVTIAVAAISYRLIEEPFLRLRGRWAS